MATEAGSSSKAETRREQRFAVRLVATLGTDAGELPVRLLDLSRTGARVEMRCPPAVGARVTLCRERMEAGARVIWARAGRCGLAFHAPIKATELFFQVGRSREAADGKETGPRFAPGRGAAGT